MQTSLRKVLVDSHVAAITIAVLIFIAVGNLYSAIGYPALRGVQFLITAIGESELPYIPHRLDLGTFFEYLGPLTGLLHAVVAFGGAWLVSHWVYGVGPLRALMNSRETLSRKSHA